MGGESVTMQNLTVHAVDVDKGLLLIKGGIPGSVGSLVFVKSAAKGVIQ
jgi:large subunit ribosomal protein L3